jgi:hypothetical protein
MSGQDQIRHRRQEYNERPKRKWKGKVIFLCTVAGGLYAAVTIPYADTFQWFADMSRMPTIVKQQDAKIDHLSARVDAGFSNSIVSDSALQNQIANTANQMTSLAAGMEKLAKAVNRIGNQRGSRSDAQEIEDFFVLNAPPHWPTNSPTNP